MNGYLSKQFFAIAVFLIQHFLNNYGFFIMMLHPTIDGKEKAIKQTDCAWETITHIIGDEAYEGITRNDKADL